MAIMATTAWPDMAINMANMGRMYILPLIYNTIHSTQFTVSSVLNEQYYTIRNIDSVVPYIYTQISNIQCLVQYIATIIQYTIQNV